MATARPQPLPAVTARTAPSLAARRRALMMMGEFALAAALPFAANAAEDDDTYDEESTLKAATEFFGKTTEGLAKVVEKAFREQGRPNGYIRGEEVAGALTVGVRYGEGELSMKKGGTSRKVYWAGPSIGFDIGANASKVFVLVYRLADVDALFKRYPGVDGSLYYIGGAGINYQRLDGVTLAPIRLGVGLRTGASVGYVHYRREKSLNPI